MFEKFIENPQYSSDITLIHSTVFDNPFCPEPIKKDILLRAERDENYKRVYLLGEKGSLEGLIYKNWSQIDEFPKDIFIKGYGLDFGYNHPTAFIKCGIKGNDLYIEQSIYKSDLTGNDLILELSKLNINKYSDEIYADIARPEIIEEIKRAGYRIIGATKGDGSVMFGINVLKQFDNIFVTKNSVETIQELRNYQWKIDKNGKPLNEPKKELDDAMDAVRYFAIMKANINKVVRNPARSKMV